jgi:hypothetical protein
MRNIAWIVWLVANEWARADTFIFPHSLHINRRFT